MRAVPTPSVIRVALGLTALLIAAGSASGLSRAPKGRIFVLMVWDGLRPDLVDDHDTPNLAAFEREGTRFSHHHAIFPTLTMVNAAALATGGSPGATGILGDGMYLAPLFDSKAASIPSIGPLLSSPLDLEHSQYLALLNGPDAFKGELMGLASVGQQVDDAGGYVAIAGK